KRKADVLRAKGKTAEADAAEADSKDPEKARAAEVQYQQDLAAQRQRLASEIDNLVVAIVNSGDQQAYVKLVGSLKATGADARSEIARLEDSKVGLGVTFAQSSGLKEGGVAYERLQPSEMK